MASHRRKITSFAFLNVVQFLGALNDNLFKVVIVFLAIGIKGEGASNIVLVLSGAAFVLPFLLFSLPAGTLSDKYSKRNITVLTKVMEVVVMAFGALVFWLESVWGSYLVLFLMATQSALFGPSKYGLVPELVKPEQITKANGILMALTVIATILGTFLASVFATLTNHDYPMIAFFCFIIAVIGLIASLIMHVTPAAGSQRRVSPNLAGEIYRVLKRSYKINYLTPAIIGSSLFFLFGSFVQLNIITFGIQSLDLTPVHGNYMFAITSVGIALGSFFVGRLSGDEVELGFCPISGLVMAFFFMLLLAFQHVLWIAVALLFVLGAAGGMYLVPFDSYIQAASPDINRGENIACGNFLSFVGVAIATALLFVFGNVLHLSAAEGFFWMGVITLVIALWYSYRLSDTFIRLLSRFKFPLHKRTVTGKELIPRETSSIIYCPTNDWKTGLDLMITLQQRYTRLVIQRPATLSLADRWTVLLGKVTFFDESFLTEATPYKKAVRALKRGYALAIIASDQLEGCRHLSTQEKLPLFEAHLAPPNVSLERLE